MFSSVLLPAPFSPINACTSPARRAKSTPSSASVAPKRLARPRSSRIRQPSLRQDDGSLQILLQRRVEQLLRLGGIEVGGRDQRDAGVDPLLDLLAEEVIDDGLHPEVAHAKRILQDHAVELLLPHGLHEDLAG